MTSNNDISTEETGETQQSNETKSQKQLLSSVVQGTAENLLGKLEEAVAENPEEMDGNEEVLQDSEPGPLSGESKDVEEVLNVISQSIYREGQGQLLLKLCDKASLLSVVSHSLSAYITTLDPLPLQRLSARIAAEVSLWLCDLFNFSNGAAYCHDDTREGLVKITRMALHKNYPKMSTDGFETLFARPPVIYLTSNTYTEIAHHICVHLGLPLSTIRVLQGTTKEKMEEMIAEDKAAGKLPTACIANVHSSLFQAINATTFQKICKDNDIWLHLEGHALAGLSLVGKKASQNLPAGDSMSLTVGSWLGIPALPFVTVYKSVGLETFAQSAGLTTVMPSVRLNCLPMWCVLRSLGAKQFRHRIGNIFEMMEILNNKLAEIKSLRLLSQRPEISLKYVTVDQLFKGDFDKSMVFRSVSPALAFQYVSENTTPEARERVPNYFNNLNSWLGQTMLRDCPQIPFEIVDIETTGYVLRLCPFESLAFSGATVTEDDLGAFIECLENQVSILDATVKQREKFIDLIDKEPKLERIEIAHWAGLGGVSYVPDEFRKDEENRELTPDEVAGTNQRNIELLQRLRTMDSAFSLGESNGRICIRFGMVSMDTDVAELLNLVVTTGVQVDEQIEQLTVMSDIVRKGIEQAAEDLKKESDDAIWQEGVLRHVPIVGSLYNWISPLQKPQIKGRFLSLDEGKLHSTEVVYKHHGMKEEDEVREEENKEGQSKETQSEEKGQEVVEQIETKEATGDGEAVNKESVQV